MRPFCETSSSSKTFTDDKKIGKALRSARFPMIHGYEVRKYDNKGNYKVINFFTSKQGAKVFKSFYEIEFDERLAIVAVSPKFSFAENYIVSDIKATADLIHSRIHDHSEGGD